MPSKSEALSSNPGTTKEEEKRRGGGEGGRRGVGEEGEYWKG
jgi:hypothetical protein